MGESFDGGVAGGAGRETRPVWFALTVPVHPEICGITQIKLIAMECSGKHREAAVSADRRDDPVWAPIGQEESADVLGLSSA
ncbi:hypothetical protein AB0J38_25240 [Streptomyces sp. NPDC050095]|uniref:hypothetical protein n=1 Tax=unclassified Streptomyces TaxID=2593676 RepID=UPI0034178896